ncbi:MAG: hypothetical protein ABJB74_08705 [Gemmatimonas sp.]
MKRRVLRLGIPLVLLSAGTAVAQSAATEAPEISSLRAPASPAFFLLGASPTEIARPQTPADFAFAIANQGAGLKTLPTNLAVEASPYWARSRPTLTWQSDTQRSLKSSLARTFAISVGTAEKGKDSTASTAFGVGFRFMPISGKLSQATIGKLNALELAAGKQAGIYNRYLLEAQKSVMARRSAAIAACNGDRTCIAETSNTFAPQLEAVAQGVLSNPQYAQDIKAAMKDIESFAMAREGLTWEIASGATWDFKNGAWNAAKRGRIGAWTTVGYEGANLGKSVTVSPLVVGRYLREDSTNTLNIFDVGAQLVMSSPNFSLSAELVRRNWSGTNAPDAANRVVGMGEYKLRENAWLFVAFGKDYDEAAADSFISKFGLSLSLKKERYAKPQ